jgi:hypothetical protein
VVVRRDVRFKEDRAFRRSLELRDRVEEVPQIQSDASKGTQPQVSSAPVSRVTGSPSTASCSQLPGIQAEGTDASGSQTTVLRSVDETIGRGDATSPLITPRKRKPRWFHETLKEAMENVGEPKRLMRESRAPERLGSYLAMVTSITYVEPMTLA